MQNRLNATLDLIFRGFTGKVKAWQGHLLDLEFENGEKRVFDPATVGMEQ